MASQTFPGFYPQILDKSLQTTPTSRFSCCLFGPATRGPFQTVVTIQSLSDFVAQLGSEIPGSWMPQAVAAVANNSDGVSVVRIGTQYTSVATGATGTAGAYVLSTPNANFFNPGDFVLVQQAGLPSTANAVVASVQNSTITFQSVGVQAEALAATYTGAVVSHSPVQDSAVQAEGFLYAPSYAGVVVAAGSLVGTKSSYTFAMSGTSAAVAVGDVLKISQAGCYTTREAQVISVLPNPTGGLPSVVQLQSTTNTATGIQAVALQDNYTAATIQKMVNPSGNGVAVHLVGNTAGTWANTVGTATGLRVQVVPGSAQDTKKLLIYLNGALVEIDDSLAVNNTLPAQTNNFTAGLAGSGYVSTLAFFGTEPPTNTRAPWNTVANTPVNTASFANGYNGENVAPADYIGTLSPTSQRTGLQVIDDRTSFNFSMIGCPGISDAGVTQAMDSIASHIFSGFPIDVPDLMDINTAIDWTNGAGQSTGNTPLNSYRGAYFWNWFQAIDPFTGVAAWMPPSVAVLGNAAQVFDQFKPWFAVAGLTRGVVSQASAVRYPRVSQTAKQNMQAGNNVVNPILYNNGGLITIWGNRSALRIPPNTTDEMTSWSHNQLVNVIIFNFGQISQKYVFDPNDATLVGQLQLEYTAYLDSVVNEEGITAYGLVMDSTVNTPAVINANNLIVNLSIIPTGVLERIFLNLTINADGATLTGISS